MKHEDTPLDRLLAAARDHAPFAASDGASALGFETRLRAALADGAQGASSALAECLAKLSWRFAAASLPLALAAAVVLALSHRHALPDGVGGIVTQWAGLFPVGI